jgi:very-short-patch-repair endonuclease
LVKEGIEGWFEKMQRNISPKNKDKLIMEKRLRVHNSKELVNIRRVLRNNPPRAEILIWKYIKNSLLGYKFRRQHSIGKYIVDFYCPELKLAIEIDGPIHDEPEKVSHDNEKSEYILSKNIQIIRIDNKETYTNIDRTIEYISSEIEKLKDSTPPPTPSLVKEGIEGWFENT